jgi:hypothetical protein
MAVTTFHDLPRAPRGAHGGNDRQGSQPGTPVSGS